MLDNVGEVRAQKETSIVIVRAKKVMRGVGFEPTLFRTTDLIVKIKALHLPKRSAITTRPPSL